VADADPEIITHVTPFVIDQRLRLRVTEAILAQGGIRHDALNAFLRERLAGSEITNGALFSEPTVEAAAPYVSSGKTPRDLSGTLLHPRVVEALTWGDEGDDYRFTHPAYAHQLEAWRELAADERRSVLVSSGTGSGKTECFLVPMLNDLAREAGQAGRLKGVRALMLYPLNALIASQEERLRRWTSPFAGDIRFGLYNGLMRDRRKLDRERDEREHPEQVLYRTTLRADPPPILVTNNTMLEYMTIRREDRPIVEASQGRLRWIVIDEAHSYVGSAAAELSLLLRRVMETFGVQPGQVRFVATSATIGGEGDAERSQLRRYLADLAGVPEQQVAVVFGRREQVALGGLGIASDPIVQKLVRALEQAPLTVPSVSRLIGDKSTGPAMLEALAAPQLDGKAPLLPLRVHQFIRAMPGLWSCLDASCPGDKPEAWPFGAILFERASRCPHCDAPAFEIVSCSDCGEPWLQAYDTGAQLSPLATPPDHDEFAATSARELDADNGESDEPQQTISLGDKRYLATREFDGDLISLTVNPKTGELPDRRDDGVSIKASRVGADDSCPRCHAAPQRGGPHPIWPFRFGAPFLIQNAAPTMLEGVAPTEASGQELPADGRRLLSFTDSRQGTARFAANIETMAERGFVRAFVYHSVQQAGRSSVPDSDTRIKLEERLAKLRPLAGDGAIDDMIRETEAALAGSAERGAVPWRDAVRGLAAEPMVRSCIAAVWDEDRDVRFADREALANFLLLRELARRPKRANAIETLGLAKLWFDPIEKLSDASVPQPLRQRRRSLSEWKDFLYFLIDAVVRTNFAVSISDADARWLLPRKTFVRAIVGPHEERRYASDVVWPLSPRPDRGSKSNAVLALEAGLGLDCSEAEDRAAVDEILERAWDQLLPLLQSVGSTRQLNMDRGSLAPVRDAWLCPVTHRVLPRLVFGRSPYALRGAAAHAPAPQALLMPRIPICFPRTAGQRAELTNFVEHDAEAAELRKTGLWGSIQDRVATFAPYIRAEEHSAQQPPHRLRAFESEFKAGKINLLACSTTMEMGVDIGSIEAVLNTNVPPSIANYRQRVGRAGRRGQGFASSLTYARDTPLDREAFRDPPAYLQRELSAPRVKLDSARIVQRHVNALLLARWFAEVDGQLTRTRAGDFFGFPQGLGLAPDENPPAKQFIDWLSLPSTTQATGGPVSRLVRGTALEGVPGLALACADMFAAARSDFERQWSALREQTVSLEPEARKSIEIMIGRMTREFLLRELTNRSLLPGHGFPTAVVPFVTDCEEVRARQRRQDDEGGETGRDRRYEYPSRNADVAIREYAPGAEIVVDGLVWESAGVTLNWERPAHDDAAREIQSIRWSWQCSNCGESGCDRQMRSECAACGSTAVASQQFLEPAGFRVDWRSKPHAQTDQLHYIEPQPPRVSAHQARWEPLLDPALGRCRATSEGTVYHHSLGSGGQGYRVCLDCGRAAEESDDALSNHIALLPPKGGGGRCAGNDKTYAITRPLALAHEVLTDVAELQPQDLEDPSAAWALLSAMREALARKLGVETRELGLSVARRPSSLGGFTHSLFLYDQASGGAGYAPRLLDDLSSLLRDAYAKLQCECERGCSRCILAPDLFAQQEIIDRKAAIAFLEPLLEELAAPDPDDAVAPDATLSQAVADALTRRVRANGMVSLFAPDEFDVAALAEEPFTGMFSAIARAGGSLRLVLAKGRVEALDDAQRMGLRNAAHRNGLELWEGSTAPVPNGATLIATLEQDGAGRGWYSRDGHAAELGVGWGIGSEFPVVEAALGPGMALAPVDAERLERSAQAGASVRIIETDPARPVRQFGTGLVNRILKSELEAAGAWKPSRLAALEYSDRYIRAPLPCLLMMQTLAALRDALAPAGTTIPLDLITAPLREDRYRGAPRRLHDNWPDEDDRADTIIALAERLGFAPDYDDQAAPHGRKLIVRYDDGSSAIILFDQGFGYWRSRGPDQHNFRASPAAQAKAMLDASATVAGDGESYIAVARN
jgi:ATP-dependent helicase YprA (DUF1998 family)